MPPDELPGPDISTEMEWRVALTGPGTPPDVTVGKGYSLANVVDVGVMVADEALDGADPDGHGLRVFRWTGSDGEDETDSYFVAYFTLERDPQGRLVALDGAGADSEWRRACSAAVPRQWGERVGVLVDHRKALP